MYTLITCISIFELAQLHWILVGIQCLIMLKRYVIARSFYKQVTVWMRSYIAIYVKSVSVNNDN